MLAEEFDQILERRLGLIKSVLASKGKEYAVDGDRLHNFNKAADRRNRSPGDVLAGMLVKHWVYVEDLVKQDGNLLFSQNLPDALIDEKIGDCINYLILLEAVLKEKHK